MPTKPANTIACGSCGTANTNEMSFCLNCGKVLSARVAAQRQARGVKKRECTSCHKADELNNRYCIFCGAEIQKRHAGDGNSEALQKFTQEISGIKDRRVSLPESQSASAVTRGGAGGGAVTASAPVRQQGFAIAMVVYVSLAVLSALGVAFLSRVNFARTFFCFSAPIKSGLILYTKEPFVDVVLESADKTHYLLGSTGVSGTLAVGDLDSGDYLARFSKTGFETVSQLIDVKGDKINLLGFDKPLVLPQSYGEGPK